MPCSACATNVLQRVLGGFEILASKTAGLPPTRHYYRTGAGHFYDAKSTPRRTSRKASFVDRSEHLDLKIVRQTSTPPTEPAVGKEDEQKETGENVKRVEAADAVGKHTRIGESERLQSHRKDSNSLDKDWWEENYSSDLRKSNHNPHPPSASEPPSVSQPEAQSPSTPPTTKPPSPDPSKDPTPPPPKPRTGPSPWQIQKAALTHKFPTGWIPRKRLSPDTLDGIRTLHLQYPLKYTTPVLAEQFKVSPEAIRRILKSKWRPSDGEEEERRVKRWENRGKSIWERMAEEGLKPPRKWREMGVRKKVGVGVLGRKRGGENRMERRRRERREGGRGEARGERGLQRGGQGRGKSRDVSTAFTMKGIPAIEAVRPESGYQVPLADRIL